MQTDGELRTCEQAKSECVEWMGGGGIRSQFGMSASPRISRRTSAVASNISSPSTVAARPARTSVTTGATAATPTTTMGGGAAFAPGGLVGGGWGTQGSLQHTLRMEGLRTRRLSEANSFVESTLAGSNLESNLGSARGQPRHMSLASTARRSDGMEAKEEGEDSSTIAVDEGAALEAWLSRLLTALVVSLAHADEPSQAVWAAALSCLWAFGTSAGSGMHAMRALLERCVQFQWAPAVHTHLAQLAMSRLYVPSVTGTFCICQTYVPATSTSHDVLTWHASECLGRAPARHLSSYWKHHQWVQSQRDYIVGTCSWTDGPVSLEFDETLSSFNVRKSFSALQ